MCVHTKNRPLDLFQIWKMISGYVTGLRKHNTRARNKRKEKKHLTDSAHEFIYPDMSAYIQANVCANICTDGRKQCQWNEWMNAKRELLFWGEEYSTTVILCRSRTRSKRNVCSSQSTKRSLIADKIKIFMTASYCFSQVTSLQEVEAKRIVNK